MHSPRDTTQPRRIGTPAAAVALLVVAAAGAGLRRVRRVEVAGGSMVPTLLPGDRLLVLAGARPRPGCLVALRDPRGGDRLLVKRVRAAGPEGVDVRGDAPAASTDSRHFGPVPPALVVGRVVWRYGPPARSGPVRGGWGAGAGVASPADA